MNSSEEEVDLPEGTQRNCSGNKTQRAGFSEGREESCSKKDQKSVENGTGRPLLILGATWGCSGSWSDACLLVILPRTLLASESS